MTARVAVRRNITQLENHSDHSPVSQAQPAAFRPSDLALLNRVNQILKNMTTDGTLNRFIKKVAGNEYPYQ
jgi:hypothetical protein